MQRRKIERQRIQYQLEDEVAKEQVIKTSCSPFKIFSNTGMLANKQAIVQLTPMKILFVRRFLAELWFAMVK